MDPFTLGMLGLLVVLIFVMFRNNRKRQQEQRDMLAKLQPGVRVMTNFGLYGTLISINEDENTAVVEVLSGAQVELHRQTIGRVIEPTVADADASASSAASE
ncbi:MAG TPA: preprotein translocase subunit YajC [Microbacteriaceae bacterium]|nr:preprotein translocase subunit YajC [Microbacteriaceae bacterium]